MRFGWPGRVLQRGGGLVVVVGEVDRVLDRVGAGAGGRRPAPRSTRRRAGGSRSGSACAARIGVRSRPRSPAGRARRPASAATVGRTSTSETSASVSRRLREQHRVRDDERDVDRLLVGVERLLAQAAVREAHLAVVGAADDHRARAQRAGIVGVAERRQDPADLLVDDPVQVGVEVDVVELRRARSRSGPR